jgi:osmotically-inducible protein OsmY
MTVRTVGTEDEVLLQNVWIAIRSLGYVKLRKLDCQCRSKTVTLRGVTDCFYMKQLVYATASKVPGVESVVDQIVVKYE